MAEKATWTEIHAMSLDEVDLLNLALDAWEDAGIPPKARS